MSSIKDNVYKKISKNKKVKPKKKDIEQRFKPYPMHVLRNLTKFERDVITPYQNKLQLSLSTKLKEADSNKMVSWDKLKAITLASVENVASKPTQLSLSGTEALVDAENDRLTIYKNGLASKSYKKVFGDIFKAVG